MTPLYIALVLFAVLTIIKFFIFDPRYRRKDKKIKDKITEAKERSDKIYEASLAFIVLFVTVYSIWLGEAQSSRRPNLTLTFDCQLDTISGMNGMNYYNIYLTNDGDIDAQVTLLKINYNQYFDNSRDYNENMFTIPTNSTKRILRKKGEITDHPNIILADYTISYSSNNGNGDLIENDSIFCK